VAALQEHNKAVTTMCVSPDHAFFVTGSDDGTLKVWTAQGPRSMLEGGKLEGGKLEGVGRREVGRSWKEGSWKEGVGMKQLE
jgi:WD40 repeat protein